jgi:hypothetical protein
VRIKVKYRKLGKEKVWGFAHSDELIELDNRLKGKKHLEILIHECLHILYPQAEEDEIVKKSVTLCNTIWHERYRRIEENNDEPLQDGSL